MPDLKTGVTVACFQSIGIEPSAKLLFIRMVSGLAIVAHAAAGKFV